MKVVREGASGGSCISDPFLFSLFESVEQQTGNST